MCDGAVLLPPPRRRRHRPPGGGRVARLITGLDAARMRANLERVRERDAGAGRRDPRRGQVRRRSRSSACSPRPASRCSARTAPRTSRPRRPRTRDVPLALHRPAAEPQGQADRPVRRADPLGRVRLRAAPARAPRHARRPRSSSRSTSPGRRARRASPRSELRRVPRALARSRRGPDDDAAVRRRSRGQPAAISPALRELADAARAAQLSMGTSQDYAVAAEEGATIVRIGTILYA